MSYPLISHNPKISHCGPGRATGISAKPDVGDRRRDRPHGVDIRHSPVHGFQLLPLADIVYVAPCSSRMRKISRCCSFAPGDPDPLLPVFSVASSIGVEPFLLGARGSAPPSMRALTARAHRLRTARCSGATPLLSTAFGSAPRAAPRTGLGVTAWQGGGEDL